MPAASDALSGYAEDLATRLAFLAANLPALFGAYSRRTDIPYGTDPQHRLDLYLPRGRARGPRPVVVFWHGGRWTFGDKRDYRFVGAALAGLGMIVAIPNYRHYPKVRLAGFRHDAALAAAWAAESAAVAAEPTPLYLMGHSAGAHLAALTALEPGCFTAQGLAVPRIAGVIGLSGPYDFLPLEEDDLKDMFGPPERYAQSQPINFVSHAAPPMLLFHGERDELVWPRNSRNLAAALRAHGVAVTLRLYPQLRHADTVAALSALARGRAPVLADIAHFILGSQGVA